MSDTLLGERSTFSDYSSPEIGPCSECGQNGARLRYYHSPHDVQWVVFCPYCNLATDLRYSGQTRQAAIDAWNGRKEDA